MSKLPCDVRENLDEAQMALEKGLLILDDVATDYPVGKQIDGINVWAYDQPRIAQYLNIALDYMYQALEKLDSAKESKDGDVA